MSSHPGDESYQVRQMLAGQHWFRARPPEIPNLWPTEDLRWRATLDEPPPWRTRVLVRSVRGWLKPGQYWYDVIRYEREPWTPFQPAWATDEGHVLPDTYPEWRPLP